eukprot:82315_1
MASASKIRLPHQVTANIVQSTQNNSIHTISYDHYGKMLATVSPDRSIKIFKLVAKQWIQIQQIKADESNHQAAIIDICWAHPLFGSIFATLSIDKTIQIFELKLTDHTDQDAQSFEFVSVASFRESVDISCCHFVPHHLGLQLAIVCKHGMVKIREARDLCNLSQWMLSERITMDQNHMKPFDQLPFNPQLLRHTHAIHNRSDPHKDTKIFCISWNHSKFEFPSFCAGGSNNTLYIFGYTASDRTSNKLNKTWNCIQKLIIPPTQARAPFDIQTVSWATTMGRKYHLIATGGSDGCIRLIKITKNAQNRQENTPFEWNVIYEEKVHKTAVRKVTWNVCGTSLVSVDDRGNVCMLKKDRRQDTYIVSDVTSKEERKPVFGAQFDVKNENSNNDNSGKNNNTNNNNAFSGFVSNGNHMNEDNSNHNNGFNGFEASNNNNNAFGSNMFGSSGFGGSNQSANTTSEPQNQNASFGGFNAFEDTNASGGNTGSGFSFGGGDTKPSWSWG